VLFSVPQALASGYLIPRLAARRDESEFRAATLRYAAFLLAIALATCAAVVLFPEPFLRLLGSGYAGLERGLLLVLASSLCSVFGAFFVQVNRIRAWTGKLWLLIQVTVAAQVVYALFVPLTSSEAVLGLGLLASVVLTTGYGLMTFLGFRRTARGERSAVST
jgi:hypothetical protein